MRCAFCGHSESRVLDSRPVEENRSIRRRRECQNCGQRYTTYERLEEIPLLVVKSDNRRELFDAGKILSGLLKACDKRAVPLEVLEQMVGDVERELRNGLEREISSKNIGELVMEHLRRVDQVAYVRFASVYRNFEDVTTFIEEIRKLKQESPDKMAPETEAGMAVANIVEANIVEANIVEASIVDASIEKVTAEEVNDV